MLQGPDGSWLTEAEAIDDAVWGHWHPILCRHNGSEDWSEAKSFITAHIHEHPGLDVRLTVEELRSACKKMSVRTAVSADGWRPRELLKLSDSLLEILLVFFDICVRQALWPQLLLISTVSLIPKSEDAATAADLRPISVLSVVYRAWSSAVTQRLIRWAASSFLPPGIKGGVPGREPMDIFLQVGIEVESAWAEQTTVCGATADVQKFFDRLPRDLVDHTCLCLGVPVTLVNAWRAHVDNSVRHFNVAGGVGRPRATTTGYPQGDALSVFASLVTTFVFHTLCQVRGVLATVLSWADNLQWFSR
jgi:hypothetical protein